MKEFQLADSLEELDVVQLDTAYAIGRTLRGGLHAYLEEAVTEHSDADVLAFSLPTPHHQVLFVAASYTAFRRLYAAEFNQFDAIDRHPAITGYGTTGSKIFGEQDSDRPGFLLSHATDEQRAVNHHVRKKPKQHDTNTATLDELAEEALDLVIENSNGGQGAHEACQMALGSTLTPLLLDNSIDTSELLHQNALEMAAVSGLLRSIPFAASVIGRMSGFDRRSGHIRISTTIENQDALSVIAGIQTLAKATYWTLYNYSRQPDLPISELVTETLRRDASPAVTMPRAQLAQPNPHTIYFISPFSVLTHPATFSDERFRDNGSKSKASLVELVVFGGGQHLCPANKFTRPFLEGILNVARNKYDGFAFKGNPRLNPIHLVSKTPTARSQGHFFIGA